MENRIFEIGTGKYRLHRRTLAAFMEEARVFSPAARGGTRLTQVRHEEIERDDQEVFYNEVIELFHAYARSEDIDLLVQLKCKLEEASVRYHSIVLAAEVLNINSCLPLDRRVGCTLEDTGA